MSAIRLLIPSLAAAVLLFPAGAQADVTLVTPLKQCYVSVDQATREPIDINAKGFTPDALVNVSIDGQIVEADVPALGGEVKGSVSGPFQDAGQRPFTLTIAEQGNATNTITTGSLVTALSLRTKPKQSKPRKRVRFIGRGFTSGEPVFGHYVFRNKLRKTVRFGVPKGPCGTFNVKRRQIPVKHPRTGRWTLQADTLRQYTRSPGSVFVRLAITVRRVLGAR